MRKIFNCLFTLPFLCVLLIYGVITVSYGAKVPTDSTSYKLIIIKKSGYYNIYTFHTLVAATETGDYLKSNIDSDIKEKIIVD